MPNNQARLAIIGTGWWSTTAHIPAALHNPAADLVALVDRRPAALQNAVASFGPTHTYTDVGDMLAQERPDGVVICVNHAAHYEVARTCLEAGVHVMLDKPMVLKATHAHHLRDLAQARGIELIIGYPWQYTENSRRARDIVQSGELGTIQYVSSLFTSMVIEFLRGNDEGYRQHFGYPVTGPGQAYADPALSGGGQGHLQVTHSAASLFLVSGLRADRVTSFMQPFDLRVDVADAIAVRFKPVANGFAPVGVLGSTGDIGVGDGGHNQIEVCGDKGRLVLEHIGGTLYVRRNDGSEAHYGPLPPEGRYLAHAPLNNLVDVILGRGNNESPAEVGVRTVELLDAAYRSAARDGQPVNVDDLLSEAD